MLPLLDSRIYKILDIRTNANIGDKYHIAPLIKKISYVGDFYETEASLIQSHQDLVDNFEDESDETRKSLLKEHATNTKNRIQTIRSKVKKANLVKMYSAGFSVIHPYALLRLHGGSTMATVKQDKDGNVITDASGNIGDDESESNIFDVKNHRKWYEIDSSNNLENYAKNPTTTDIINFGMQDPRGRFPYSFTDFVYCKYWNKIQNNRMITLRRYPNPVTDNVEPNNFVGGAETIQDTGGNDSSTSQNTEETVLKDLPSAYSSTAPYTPLVTAITYFGEGTGNTLSSLLKFSIGYNWSEAKSDVWTSTSTQSEGSNMINNDQSWLSSGIGQLSEILGVLGDFKGSQKINPTYSAGLAPDPYAQDNAYENRIIGPINVIDKVKKRDRGLKFVHDGLSVTFEYVARPIAGINNKAIMLDLFANMMAMTGSSGQFFGGARRYRNEHPAIYPWRSLSEWNKLYSGKLFGKKGMFYSMFTRVFNSDNMSFLGGVVKDLMNGVCQMAKDLVSSLTSSGKDNSEEADKNREKGNLLLNKLEGTAGRALAAKWVKGTNAPWLQSAHALLTGEPVGDWHLTIGNPLNPIATIGNLIVEDAEYEFSDELGPDDFPISFKCTVHLKHGMERDKDAAESMFNRGAGRIYILSDKFKSSADSETTVDAYTGVNNPYKDTFGYDPTYGILVPSGADYMMNKKLAKIPNSTDYNTVLPTYNPRSFANQIQEFSSKYNYGIDTDVIFNSYKVSNRFMHHIL